MRTRRRVVAFWISVLALGMPAPASSQTPEASATYERIEALHGESGAFAEAAAQLRAAMNADDGEAVARLGLYPMVVSANGEMYDILAEHDLADNFDRLVSPELRRAVAASPPEELIVNSDGVGFADGALWMALACLDDACRTSAWRLVSINDDALEGPRADVPPAELPRPAASWGGRVRSGPGTTYPQIASLNEGDPVTLIEMTDVVDQDYPWFRIELADGRSGYQWGGILCGLDESVPGVHGRCR